MENTSSRYTLRDLPLPAKLVVSVFLISVGLGYGWAMMQLHFKHADKGELMPGIDAVVARFSGVVPPWKKEEAAPAENKAEEKNGSGTEQKGNGDRRAQREPANRPEPKKAADKAPPKMVAGARIKTIIAERCAICHAPDGEMDKVPLVTFADISKLLDDNPKKGKLYQVLAKEDESSFSKDNMKQAFTKKSIVKVNGEELEWKDFVKTHPEKEAGVREERETERLVLIAWLEAGAPEDAYTKDAFPLPDELNAKPFTKDYTTQAPAIAKVAADAGNAAFNTAKKRKNAKDCQLSIESLTQSTHAHLLSFAVLWALTGLTFAFTSYPLWIRCGLAPVVLLFQVVDVAFWWLARLPDVGPYFAVGIMGTGAIVGLGLMAQIVLSLFNMYGGKGKAVLLILFLAAGAGGGLVFTKYVQPHIAAEKEG